MYTLYVLECADGTLYTGITTDAQRRVAEHNSSRRGARYTRSRRPVVLVHSQSFATRSDALVAEAALRKLSRSKKLARIRLVS
ncbi:GIY-YIG nuclease family protein [Candidatus Berkelbacteria bacterium]|nr:GIY-YIG nuclease family protein [Candidatus Berkelbacteria bacterium]